MMTSSLREKSHYNLQVHIYIRIIMRIHVATQGTQNDRKINTKLSII